MGFVVREMFGGGVGVATHAMERERLDGFGEGGVGVAVLGPAIDLEKKIAGPALGKRSELRGVEQEAQLVAGAYDYQAVVDVFGQLADVAVAGVEAGRGIPEGRGFGGVVG